MGRDPGKAGTQGSSRPCWQRWLQERSASVFTVPYAPRGCPKSWFPRAGMAGQGEGDGFYLPICRPGQGSALGWFSFAAGADHLLLQLVHDDFAFQVLQEKDDDDEGTRSPAGRLPRPNPTQVRNAVREQRFAQKQPLDFRTEMQSDGIEVFHHGAVALPYGHPNPPRPRASVAAASPNPGGDAPPGELLLQDLRSKARISTAKVTPNPARPKS